MKLLTTFLLLFTIITPTIATNSTNEQVLIRRKRFFDIVNTHFTFTATVHCQEAQKQRLYWCVELNYYELDTFDDDDIAPPTWSCGYEAHRVLETRTIVDGDGLGDWEYELEVRTRHNCRSDGRYVEYVQPLPTTSTSVAMVSLAHTISL